MLFTKTENWKSFLSGSDEKRLNNILKEIAELRAAYKNADNIKIAQLWCGMIRLEKKKDNLNARIRRIENILETITEKDSKEKEALLESLRNM